MRFLHVPRFMQAQHGLRAFRWLAATSIVIVHAGAIGCLINLSHRYQRDAQFPREDPFALVFIGDEPTRAALPVPEVTLSTPPMQKAIRVVRFESRDWGDISGVTAPASAPMLSRFQRVTPASFARLAGLDAGQAVSILLAVEVLPDGSVGAVEVVRGSGSAAIDAAAVAYARKLRWVPGTEGHRAQTMRINFPVTLVWTA